MLDEKKLSQKIEELAEVAKLSTIIDSSLYEKHDVKRGLRDLDGKGVVAGLTEISEINSKKIGEDGMPVSADGELFYRGINIKDIVKGFSRENRLGFEEVTYLLLFGKLPSNKELSLFCEILGQLRKLPVNFVRDVIMKKPSKDMMNTLSRGVLTLYAYDKNPDDVSLTNVLRQCLYLIAQTPLLSVYGYQVAQHYHHNESLIIHKPDPTLGTAENILHLLRSDSSFTPLEAKILDICLVLHAEHGGGNNSSFTTHVVSSSGTDTYSTITASLGSLKGPRHGGANAKVVSMIEDIKNNITSHSDSAISNYLIRILNREAFDQKGLIYGMGHAVYSKSDPRAEILRDFAKRLATEKKMEKEYALFRAIERLAPEVIAHKRKIYKGVSANVDFYSGLVYSMLGIPQELFTPIFAIGRMPGWSAHRIEELSNNGKIIRPAYVAVAPRQKYIKLEKR